MWVHCRGIRGLVLRHRRRLNVLLGWILLGWVVLRSVLLIWVLVASVLLGCRGLGRIHKRLAVLHWCGRLYCLGKGSGLEALWVARWGSLGW